MRKILFALGFLCLTMSSYSQLTTKSLTAGNGTFIGFWEFKPSGYSSSSTKKYPLLIWLHGAGEKGNGTSDLYLVTNNAIMAKIKNGNPMTFTNPATGQSESFLVLAPQLSPNYGSWENFYAEEMIKYAKANLQVDPDRIVMTGLSLGGGGTWKYANGSLANSQNLAAIAPVCGSCDYNLSTMGSTIGYGKTAVWTFHAVDDQICGVDCARNAVSAIKASGTTAEVKATIYDWGNHWIWDRAYDDGHSIQSPNIYEWFLSKSRSGSYSAPSPTPTPSPSNVAPVANAGSDMTISLPNSATLNGSGSYDPDGSIASFRWSVVSGPASFTFSSTSSAITTMTNLWQGTYVFRLHVTDNSGTVSTDDVTVVVNGSTGGGGTTTSFTANAGTDVTMTLPTNSVNLNGSATPASGYSISSYRWSVVSGPSLWTFSNAFIASPNVSNLLQGTYVFRLHVTDNRGVVVTDDVNITVNGSTGGGGTTTSFTANAGSDKSITLPTHSVVLNGSGTPLSGYSISSYRWAVISGPSLWTFSNAFIASPTVSNLLQGTYVFRLYVTDNRGVVVTDDVNVVVNGSGGTQTFSANAGSDRSITLPTNSVVLNGSATPATGYSIASYRWAVVSGPWLYTFSNAYIPNPTMTNLLAGTYVFRFYVTDNRGVVVTDDVNVYVNSSGVAAVQGMAINVTETPTSTSEQVAVYPNIVHDVVNLKWNSAYKGNATITIVDASGRAAKMIQARKEQANYTNNISVNGLKSGMYLLNIKTKDGKGVTTKFMKD